MTLGRGLKKKTKLTFLFMLMGMRIGGRDTFDITVYFHGSESGSGSQP